MNELIPENDLPINQEAKKLLAEGAWPMDLYLVQLAREGLERWDSDEMTLLMDSLFWPPVWHEGKFKPTGVAKALMEQIFPEGPENEPSLAKMGAEKAQDYLLHQIKLQLLNN